MSLARWLSSTCPDSISAIRISSRLTHVEELGPAGDLALGQAPRSGILDQPQHLLVVGLGPVLGDVPLGLGEHRGDAAIDHEPGPCGVLGRITGACGLALTALISATLAVFSQTRASTALRLVPIASR